jgi:hypothetical protein
MRSTALMVLDAPSLEAAAFVRYVSVIVACSIRMAGMISNENFSIDAGAGDCTDCT